LPLSADYSRRRAADAKRVDAWRAEGAQNWPSTARAYPLCRWCPAPGWRARSLGVGTGRCAGRFVVLRHPRGRRIWSISPVCSPFWAPGRGVAGGRDRDLVWSDPVW